jgi:hypothetical protein
MKRIKTDKKGYVLVVVTLFTIIAVASSVAFYSSVRHLGREIGAGGVGRVRGYWAARASLEYFAMLDLSLLLGPAEIVTISVWNSYNGFARDIGLNGPIGKDDVLVTITRSGYDFRLSASYAY